MYTCLNKYLPSYSRCLHSSFPSYTFFVAASSLMHAGSLELLAGGCWVETLFLSAHVIEYALLIYIWLTSVGHFLTFWLHGLLYFLEPCAEPSEHIFYVATFLHGDQSGMVLFIYPDEEVLCIIVPDTPGIWPVPSHPSCQQEGGNWLVKEEVVVNQLLLLFLCHVAEGIVLSCKLQRKQCEH